MLRRWRLAAKAAAPQTYAIEGGVKGGADGENQVQQLILQAGVDSSSVFANLRLPIIARSRPREIDLLVLTRERLAVLEVKNWSGRAYIRNKQWIQCRRSGEEINHGDPINTTWQKTFDLSNYLADQGVSLPHGFIAYKIVLPNKNLEVSSELAGKDEVVSPNDFPLFFSSLREGLLTRTLGVSLPAIFGGPKQLLTTAEFAALKAVLAKTPTWDSVQLVGGKVVCGDLVLPHHEGGAFAGWAGYSSMSGGGGGVNQNQSSVDSAAAAAASSSTTSSIEGKPKLPKLSRENVTMLTFNHTRTFWLGAVYATVGYNPEVQVQCTPRLGTESEPASKEANKPFNLSLDATIEMQPAGEREIVTFHANDIEKIILSPPAPRRRRGSAPS